MATNEPMTGPGGLAKAVEEGRDPNADLVMRSDDSVTKAEAAVSLRISGASYTSIAKVLEYSSAFRARQAVEQALALSAESPEERDQLRVLASRRLNRLLQSVMPKALDPRDPQQLAYNARALAIIDRDIKLFGVDAPTQIQITPTEERISEWVEKMRPLADADRDAEESDVFDAEIIED